ncbi:DUF1120 domain-containing protein [Pseudomonas poae]|uniref:DUF1120 domain-containing protein n=1 Tax=Pseudomonas poae TaxID=200451 RepID=A0A2S9EVL0_9PSED|nr:DUF1120 domain-containing protein [Pseudomonas poae]PRA28750.1 hypothetical protein CQZ97_14045 [Pseudomonas poae]PRC20447.1 hypothetical protein CQZ99_07290 [Pseudomonas poae]
MNKTLTSLVASLVLSSATSVFAASSVDLTVKGLITPSACTPSLSGGGVIDHGKISSKDLQADKSTLIGTHILILTVNCDAAILMAVHSIDNRLGSSPLPSGFGLGWINGTQELGWYQLALLNPIADNVAVGTILSSDGGETWVDDNYWDRGLYMSVAAVTDASQPVAIKDLTVDLRVQTVIARTDGLDLSNEVPIDGSATLEVKYL